MEKKDSALRDWVARWAGFPTWGLVQLARLEKPQAEPMLTLPVRKVTIAVWPSPAQL